jgi:hypothetical protein
LKYWLGRQDSNLGMAESKSSYFYLFINGHSEKTGKCRVNVANGLATISERRCLLQLHYALHAKPQPNPARPLLQRIDYALTVEKNAFGLIDRFLSLAASSEQAVMSAARHPRNAEFIGVFARLQTLLFTFVHAVSLVNHWSASPAIGRRAGSSAQAGLDSGKAPLTGTARRA